MMGAGKSSVGRALATLTERTFEDTDLLLQRRLGRTIPELFRLYGEEAFRAHETAVLRSLEPDNAVLATGGGIVTRPANWDELRRIGTTIFLYASPEILLGRLEASKKRRPLLESPDWQERALSILDERLPIYQLADLTVSMDDAPIEEAAERVLAALKEGGFA